MNIQQDLLQQNGELEHQRSVDNTPKPHPDNVLFEDRQSRRQSLLSETMDRSVIAVIRQRLMSGFTAPTDACSAPGRHHLLQVHRNIQKTFVSASKCENHYRGSLIFSTFLEYQMKATSLVKGNQGRTRDEKRRTATTMNNESTNSLPFV